MRAANFTVSSMHNEMAQKEKDVVMAEFRGGTSYISHTPPYLEILMKTVAGACLLQPICGPEG
jgi:hypothetical protein